MDELKYTAVQMADLRRRDGLAPIRQELGITSFGINAWVGREVGDQLVPEHEEAELGLEEVYIVSSGRATFTIDGDQIDAPSGTIVYPHDAGVVRGAVAAEPHTTILAVGGTPGKAYAPNGWETNSLAVALLKEEQYAEAIRVLSEALEADPANSYFRYNRACAEALGGHLDEAINDLTAAINADQGFREIAQQDSDLDPVRDDPRFAPLTAQA